MTIQYQPEDSTAHINVGVQMDYDLHRWACQTWGYGPTATARALVLNDTVGEAKAWLDRTQNGSDSITATGQSGSSTDDNGSTEPTPTEGGEG